MPGSACNRRQCGQLLAALCLAGTGPSAVAAERPVRLTVAYPPGGLSDEMARELASRLEPRLQRSIVVDHRAGVGGRLALEALARGRGNGSQLVFSAIMPLLQMQRHAATGADPLAAIAPVAALMETPVLVAATPAFPGSGINDVVTQARRSPGALRWATSGSGTTGHLVLERLATAAQISITHVPYSGGGRQLIDALAGQFELLSTNVAERQLNYLADGRLRALAVGAAQRLAALPDVPTFAELGFPAANLASVFGIFASRATPDAELEQLNRQINAVLAESGFRRRLLAGNHLPIIESRQAFTDRIAAAFAAIDDPASTLLRTRR